MPLEQFQWLLFGLINRAMNLTDLETAVAGIATIVAAFYAVLAYHRPKDAPVARSSSARAGTTRLEPSKPRTAIPIIAALVAFGAVAFGFVDRHWLTQSPDVETPLTPENARIDVRNLVPVLNENHLFFNVIYANDGKRNATSPMHNGLVTSALIRMDDVFIDAFFYALRKGLHTVEPTQSEYYAGESDKFFSVPDTPGGIVFDDNTLAAYKGGSLFVYLFVGMKYTDDTISSSRAIYTEYCRYLLAGALHDCESGHNRSFIAAAK
jgi:hypothetical protein